MNNFTTINEIVSSVYPATSKAALKAATIDYCVIHSLAKYNHGYLMNE
jgi:hypothetical protein